MIARGGSLAAFTVVTLSALYITLLTSVMSLLTAGLVTTPFGQGAGAELVLGILGSSFLIVALIVSTVVVTNAFALITATRVREIALRRLLGASARSERRRIAAFGTRLSLLATVAGAALAAGAAAIIYAVGSGQGGMLEGVPATALLTPWVVLPLAALIACTTIAAWRGSAAVLGAEPVQALGLAATQEAGGADERRRLGATATTLLIAGLVILAGAFAAGAITPFAALIGIVGGTVLVIGVLAGAHTLLPTVFGLLSTALPRTGPAAIARRTVREHPSRTTRAALGVLISVAVVTMFVVATMSAAAAITATYADSSLEDQSAEVLLVVLAVVGALIGFIVLIAAVGLATTVALNTRLRAREIAVTRILGQGRADAARSVMIESAILSVGGSLAGLVLGAFLGWVGAQSILGSNVVGYVIPPVLPLAYLALVVLAALVLTVASSIAPSRFVLADSPIRAFARA